MWEIEGTDQFSDWYDGLSADQRAQIDVRVEELADKVRCFGAQSSARSVGLEYTT